MRVTTLAFERSAFGEDTVSASKTNDMRVDVIRAALDNLARNAIVRSIALAH
jgi:hypothetical protein